MQFDRDLKHTFPFNLAYDLLGEDFYRVYIPGIESALDTLSKREVDILLKRYSQHLSLAECGRFYGITRERVRKIQVCALQKLKLPRRKSLYVAVSKAQFEEQVSMTQAEEQKTIILKHALDKESIADDSIADHVLKGNVLLNDLELSVRAYNCLSREGVQTLYDICNMTAYKLLQINNFGKTSLEEVRACVRKHGLSINGE